MSLSTLAPATHNKGKRVLEVAALKMVKCRFLRLYDTFVFCVKKKKSSSRHFNVSFGSINAVHG